MKANLTGKADPEVEYTHLDNKTKRLSTTQKDKTNY
jgi:hypothetical protein